MTENRECPHCHSISETPGKLCPTCGEPLQGRGAVDRTDPAAIGLKEFRRVEDRPDGRDAERGDIGTADEKGGKKGRAVRGSETQESVSSVRGIILPAIDVDSSLVPSFWTEVSRRKGKPGWWRKTALGKAILSPTRRQRARLDRDWRNPVEADGPLVLTDEFEDRGREDGGPSSTDGLSLRSATQNAAAQSLGSYLQSTERGINARVKTFVEGFDEAIEGGIPEGHVVIVSGSPGTMKSTLSFYVLLNNASRAGRKGLYVTLEESSWSLMKQMSSMGLELDAAGDSFGMLDATWFRAIVKNSPQGWLDSMKSAMESEIKKRGYEIIVIDSLGALDVLAQFNNRRQDLFNLFQWFRDLGLTSFIIAERPDIVIGGNVIMGRWDEESLSDGIIQLRLHHSSDVEVHRRIRCVKMRSTRHRTDYMTMLIDDGVLRATQALCP